MQHAHAFEPVQNGRIYIEKLNGPFLFDDKGTPAEYAEGLDRAISLGWLKMHDSGTFVRLTQSGAHLFAMMADAQRHRRHGFQKTVRPQSGGPGWDRGVWACVPLGSVRSHLNRAIRSGPVVPKHSVHRYSLAMARRYGYSLQF